MGKIKLHTALNCKICERPLSLRQSKVCSRNCQAEHFRRMYRGKGKSPYIRIRVNGERILLHRFIWQQSNGRKLKDGEIVHHLNEDKRDNRPENLEMLSGRAAHLHAHNYHRKNQSTTTIEDFAEFGF